MAAEKIAITLDSNLLSRVEAIRRVTHESRSAVIARAVRTLVAEQEHHEKVARYLEAYRRAPETDADAGAALAMAKHVLRQLPWEDDDEAR
jgi:metal-responsive CopG/Arc/MetJ family transcriptional regulator